MPLIDRDEPRFSEASREMIERHDYIVPYFNDEYRFDKPPFTYWAQIVSYHLFGENDFAARFPSAVAASLVAVVLFGWGRRMVDQTVGIWAAIIFSLSFQVVEHAKAAVADMWLVLFVTVAHWAAYELIFGKGPTLTAQRTTSNWKWWSAFYVSLAFAFLAKGPIGWTPLLTVWITAMFMRHEQLAARFKFLPGIIITIGLVCLWGIPALLRTHGEFFSVGIGRHVVERSFSPLGGHGAKSFGVYLLLLPFYFLTVFVSFFPWSLKLPWLIGQLRARRDVVDVYLLTGIGVIFVIFSLVTTKLLHYTLPAFPLLALLLSRRWFVSGRSVTFLQKTAVSFAAVCLLLLILLGPFVARLFPSRALFNTSQADLKPEMKFAAVDFKEPSLVWYFRSRVRGFMRTWDMDAETAQSFMEEAGPRFVVLPTAMAQQVYPVLPVGWKDFRARGFNLVKGKRSDLTLLLKPE